MSHPAASHTSTAGGSLKRTAADTAKAERAKKSRADVAPSSRPATSGMTPAAPCPQPISTRRAPAAASAVPLSTSAPNTAERPAEPAAIPAPSAQPVIEEVVSARANQERATANVVVLVDEEEPAATQAGLAADSPATLIGETAATVVLVVRPTATPQDIDLLEKFQKEYAGCAVDPDADPAVAQTAVG